MKRKRTRKSTNDPLDKSLLNFFVEKRNDGVPLSGPILQAQAEILSQSNGSPINNFLCTR
jgi:hypothetical protein